MNRIRETSRKFLLAILVFTATVVNAQVFPVQVSVHLTPPYTPYLSDYTAPGSQKLLIQISFNDATVVDYACRLRITIEGVGITLRTRSDYSFQPIMLEGAGVTRTLYGEDLRAYFHPDAMDFAGFPRGDFQQRARLPEGVYRFSVEVLDYHRGTIVSNRGTATAWVALNDPPMLNMPANFSKLPLRDPLNIPFMWTPRHTGSPNAAFTTEYSFRLIELWPANRNAYDAFLTQAPLYETTTTETQLLYDAAAPPLLPGRTYAWRVEARDAGGADLFRNDGRSEVFVFQYGESLAIPQNLRMRWAKPTTLAIQWDPVKTNDDVRYRLQYRPRRRSDNREWYETWTRFTDKTLYHLQTYTEYEMRIRSENALQESAYSDIRIFRTLPADSVGFVCRDDLEPPPAPENSLPVFPLSINDTLHAGGYDVVVRDVMRDGSRYYGSGLVIVPWFNGAKVRVTFEKITVNEQFWLTAGTIKSVWNGGNSAFLIEHQVPEEPAHTPKVGDIDVTIASVDTLIHVTGSAVVSVARDEDGNTVITTTSGEQLTLAKGERVAITDEVGNGYVIDEKANITKTTATEATAAAQRGKRVYESGLHFARGQGRFGFDEKKYNGLASYYQQLPDGTHASWKALSSASPDEVDAVVNSSDTNADRIVFEAGGAPLTPVAREGNAWTLRLQGKAGGMEEELLALVSPADTVPPRTIGKLNLATYNPIRHNVEIVPVNGALLPGGVDAEMIERYLNEVFGQAVVSWSVSVRNSLEVPVSEPFDDGATAVFSNYSTDMKKVLKAFGSFSDNTWYLFIVETPRNAGKLGYMPRGRPAGFVFSGPHENDRDEFLKTIAHELGHGAFNLQHTFVEHSLPSGVTDNLMDYAEGMALYKYQWDHMHEPQGLSRWFEGGGDEDSERALARAAFFEQAAPLLKEPAYRERVERFRRVYEFFEACHGEGWESYNGSGVFPYCFWRDQEVPEWMRYSIADLPFTAGMVDGGYVELEGMYHLPDVIREVSALPGKLLYAYTVAYWQCRSSKLIASAEDYEYVVTQLAEMEEEGGLWNWVREQWHDYEGEKESLEAHFKDCRDAEELRDGVERLHDLVTNWEEIKALSGQVFENLQVYWDTLKTDTNQGRYERGALIIPTATLVLPLGAGVASKAEKLKAILKVLREASKEDFGRLAKRIGEVMVRGGNRLPAKLRTIYDDCLKAGYKAVKEGDEIFITTADKTVVAKISNNNLHIKIPHGTGWATQSNSALALEVREQLKYSNKVFRIGRLKQSHTAEAQYWSPENPLDFPTVRDYADRYGIPPENITGDDVFYEVGTISENIPYITRVAPPFGPSTGGGIEVVVPAGGVKLENLSTLDNVK